MTGRIRIPAEWEPHACCWLAYPYLDAEWPDNLARAQASIVELSRTIAEVGGEQVRLLVASESLEGEARARLGDAEGVETIIAPYGDCWTRDTFPVFGLCPDGRLAAVRFRFDGWGGKFQIPDDGTVGDWVSARADVRRDVDFVIEGGALELDGRGTCITTATCVLDPHRNANETRASVEQRLGDALGTDRVVWLTRGLSHDHTGGHVDMLARFVAEGVVANTRPASGDPDETILQQVERELQAAGLEVLPLPSPGLVRSPDGDPLPATYCNFYIANEAVIVPQYGGPTDAEALGRLAQAFPDRAVVGLAAVELLRGGGAFHCVTRQEPLLR